MHIQRNLIIFIGLFCIALLFIYSFNGKYEDVVNVTGQFTPSFMDTSRQIKNIDNIDPSSEKTHDTNENLTNEDLRIASTVENINLTHTRIVIKHMSNSVYKIVTDIERIKGDKSDEYLIENILYGDDIIFRITMNSMCPTCYEAVLFYEKNMHSELLSIEEYKEFMKTDVFREIYKFKLVEMCDKYEFRELLNCVERKRLNK